MVRMNGLLIGFAMQGTLLKGEKYDLLINDNFPVEVRNFNIFAFENYLFSSQS